MMRPLTALLTMVPLVHGCAIIIGNSSADMGDRYVVPQLMRSGDVGIACRAGGGLGAVIGSFADYSPRARKTTVTTRMASGMCLDGPVWEAQLDRARSMYLQDPELAKDSRIREKRVRQLAAQRYFGAYEALEIAYGLDGVDPAAPEITCPKFRNDDDEVSFLLGLSSGVLAAINDTVAEGSAGVPMDVPARVARYAGCLDNGKWWGVPHAVQAAVWSVLPTAPADVDAWATFDESIAIGQAAGVRLAIAFKAQAAATSGQRDKLVEAIGSMGEASEVSGDPDWSMLDMYALLLVQHESDRIWTEARGHRTPFGRLGELPEDEEAPIEVSDDLGGLLDGLLVPEDASTSSSEE